MPPLIPLQQGAFEALRAAGLEPLRPRFDVGLQGSPQRCAERLAVLCSSDGPEGPGGESLWIAERLLPGQTQGREAVARTLQELRGAGFTACAPYLPFPGQHNPRFVLSQGEDAWQVSPFLHGAPLPRPEYLEDHGAGESLGMALASLQKAGMRLPEETTSALPRLELEAYCLGLVEEIARRRPSLARVVSPIAGSLAPLWQRWSALPFALAHGDCHPLNVIWTRTGGGLNVLALIDWEFCGMRPVTYDLANCLGCVGIEHPDGLEESFAQGLLKGFFRQAESDSISANVLAHLVLALRFGWLAEWLRAGDADMIALEVEYMRLLARETSELNGFWASCK